MGNKVELKFETTDDCCGGKRGLWHPILSNYSMFGVNEQRVHWIYVAVSSVKYYWVWMAKPRFKDDLWRSVVRF